MKIERDMEDILGQFFKNYNKLLTMYEVKKKEQSNTEKELASFYHMVEGTHFSHNTQAHNPMLRLKDILGRRRQLKLDIILIKSFLDTTSQSMNTAKKRTDKAVKRHNDVLNEMG